MNKQFQSFKKRATQLAITVALVGATAVGANAAHLGQTTGRVNFRKDATTKSTVIEKIAKGTDVTITGEKGNFFKIKYDGQSGYVSKKYVNENKYSVKSLAGTVTAKDGVNLRKGPGTDYEKAGRLNAGKTLEVVGQASNGWYKVKLADGTTAFVTNLDKYIEYNKDVEVKPYEGQVKAKEDLNVRKGPGTGYDVIARLREGDVVEPTGQAANGWYQIKLADGTVGYITGSSKYVEKVTEPEQKDEKAPVITVKDTLELTVGDEFKNENLGAKAEDETDGDLTSAIVFTGDVDTTKAGTYTVKLSVKDKAGNEGTAEVKVTVKEKDTNAPVIAVGVDTPYQVTQNREFKVEDLKASAFDKEEQKSVEITYTYKDSTGKAIDKIDTSKIGEYTVTLTAEDKAGNKATKDVTVNVVRGAIPVIDCKYNGDNAYEILVNKTFDVNKLGAKATDKEDGDLTSKIKYTYYKGKSKDDVKDTNKVDKIDTSKANQSYVVVMTVKDSDGNEVKEYAVVKVVNELNLTIELKNHKDGGKINAGEKFDTSDEGLKEYFGVKATDANGNDITKDVKVLVKKSDDATKTSIDATKTSKLETPDTYNITFQVSNGGAAKVTTTQLKVEDDGFDIKWGLNVTKDSTNTTQSGKKWYTLKVNSDDTFTPEQLKASAKFLTQEQQDKGLEGTSCTVKYGNKTIDTTISGSTFTVPVTFTNENGVSKTVYVAVYVASLTDNTAPVITLNDNTKVKNDTLEIKFEQEAKDKSKHITKAELLEMIKAEVTDKEDKLDKKLIDGTLTGSTITLKDQDGDSVGYVDSLQLDKTYTLTIEYKDQGVKDANGNIIQQKVATKTINIKVVNKN